MSFQEPTEKNRRLSVEKIRKIEPSLSDFSDEEIEQIRDDCYDLIQLAFDAWWTKRHGSKNPVGLLASASNKDSV